MKGSAMEQYAKRNTAKKRRNISLRLAAGLLCLLLGISCYLVGIMARHTTTAASGGDARVAKFLITEDVKPSDKFQVGIDAVEIAGEMEPETIAVLEITNGGEVDVEYTITVKNVYGNLPVKLSIENTPEEEQGNTLSFKTQMSPGAEKKTYQLQLGWPSGKNALDYMGMVDYISVTAEAVQID